MNGAPAGAINSLLLNPFGSMDCSFLPAVALTFSFLPSAAVTKVSLNCVLPPNTTTFFPAPRSSPCTSAPCGMTTLPVTRKSCCTRNFSGVPGPNPEGMSDIRAIGSGVPPTTVTEPSTTGALTAGGAGAGTVTAGGGATATGCDTGGGKVTGADVELVIAGAVEPGTVDGRRSPEATAALGFRITSMTRSGTP